MYGCCFFNFLFSIVLHVIKKQLPYGDVQFGVLLKRGTENGTKRNNFLFVCGFSSHSRIFTHIETSSLPMKGCKF